MLFCPFYMVRLVKMEPFKDYLRWRTFPMLAAACSRHHDGMDKVTMKALFRDAGLPICRYLWFLRSRWRSAQSEILRRIKARNWVSCFVKPANLGSSVGISKASNRVSSNTGR